MLKNISFLTPASALALASILIACVVVTDDGATLGDTSTAGDGDGDGDGDATTGDGDGDAGDGDGDAGDGDGDGDAGDGDGDAGDGDGDGDGDPVGACGWNAAGDPPGYYCGGAGEDPEGTFPLACAEGLVDGDPCGDLVTGAGCCDANGDTWYCGQGDIIVFEACPA